MDIRNTSSGALIRAIERLTMESTLPVKKLTKKTVQGIQARLEEVRTLLYIKHANAIDEMTISSASHAGSL